MAGVSTSSDSRGKRAVDQEINMVPFIDLLMVTISFLLITAVWNAMGHLLARADVPSGQGPRASSEVEEPWVLQVRASGRTQTFTLQWQRGSKVDDLATVPMQDVEGHYVQLEAQVRQAYEQGLATRRLHGDVSSAGASKDPHVFAPNAAILRVDNDTPVAAIVRMLDAIGSPQRKVCEASCCVGPGEHEHGGCARAALRPAFAPTFSSQ